VGTSRTDEDGEPLSSSRTPCQGPESCEGHCATCAGDSGYSGAHDLRRLSHHFAFVEIVGMLELGLQCEGGAQEMISARSRQMAMVEPRPLAKVQNPKGLKDLFNQIGILSGAAKT